jgi:Tfp pilus assembly protein PilV
MMNDKRTMKHRSRQSGLSLVEVLIGMLLGLFLVGGVLQVFASSRQTYRVHDATSRMRVVEWLWKSSRETYAWRISGVAPATPLMS